ncbi:MAG: FlxA-like family protein [Lachnospiraceae bacterium]|nr:FlxA-like family protein [Lachnospiraceae bacterium]
MTINGINGANTQAGQVGMNQITDSYSRNIQNQITNAQKQLQELSSNENMTLEEKMKKRQEIQQQISDLNMQLRQHQMEQRKEKQQTKSSSMDDMLGSTKSGKTGSESSGLSQASMTAMISAGSSMKQAKVQGSVATKIEGRAGVLESEIKLDKVRGNDTQKKEEELADVEQTAMKATAAQMNTLSDANKRLEEAAKADSRAEKTDGKDTDTKDTGEGVSSTDAQEESVSDAESINTQVAESTVAPQPTTYKSVDIRL